MNAVNRVWVMLAFVLAMLAGCAQTAMAQVTTTVSDTVYTATGAPAAGTVLVSWGDFTTAGGQAVAAGTTSVTLGAGGSLTIALAPNAGGTPMGSYYTAIFHLSDGTTSKHFWVIPVTVPGGGPAKLAAIDNSVLPTSVAMQTVSKAYVDNAIAQAQITPIPLDASPYVLKAGDTMTGPLQLPADPVSPFQAADKQYVDENIAAVGGGVSGTVRTQPSVTQNVVQPSGTELGVNILNGELYASQFVSGSGGNGIANAVASADCASGCKVVVEPTYGSEPVTLGAEPNGLVVEDQRGGSDAQTVVNPLGSSSFSAARSVTQFNTMTQQQLNTLRPGSLAIGAAAEQLETVAQTGGVNLYPAEIESPPYFKSTYGVLALTGIYNTQGQHVQLNNDIFCYGVGDCLAGGQFISSSGGYRDNSDEGAHPFDLQVMEDSNVFQGACATGCATGSTALVVTPTSAGGTQGDGRFLADIAAAKTISTGTIIGGGRTIFGTAQFSGTSFPVSVFLATATAATSQASNVAPGTVTLPIATSGVTTGFATSTAALPASSGTACVADVEAGGNPFPNYEMAPYSVVDATHLRLTLNKPHAAGAAVAVGGLCGYGLDQTVDDVGPIKQVFPVVGSTSATGLYYADGNTTAIGGEAGAASTSGYLNVALGVASIARTGNVVTVTTTANLPEDVNGLTLTVSGVADSSYNGSYAVTTTGSSTLTYTNSGPNSTSSGGTLAMVTGGYNLYPIAEVLSVYNPASHTVDGTFTLAPNTVAWGTGDAVEEPHYHQQNTSADTEIVTQYVPRPIQYVEAGKSYVGNVTAGLRGWQVSNGQPASYYFGSGGTHNLPDDAYAVSGAWRNDFEVEAGTKSLIYAHCNVNGCNRWDSGYDLFLLDSAVGSDVENYNPQSSTVGWSMRGVNYSFSPTAFTAGTINVGTLNATTITGGVNGSAINSGTVSAARLPLFGPSGTTHAPGIVPDPGATAGATRYLREDGTWDVPAGGSGGGSGGSPTGTAGGDLTGSYPNPTVAAVHATRGTLDGVTVGATTPATGRFTTLSTTSNTANSLLLGGAAALSGAGADAVTVFGTAPGAQHTAALASYNNNDSRTAFQFWAEIGGVETVLGEFGTGRLNNTCEDFYVAMYGPGSGGFYPFYAACTGAFVGINNTSPTHTLEVTGTLGAGSANQFAVDGNGNATVPSVSGPATAPSGSCSTNGAWVFSQDGHATFCASGTWVNKI